jgi:hypothetical protein
MSESVLDINMPREPNIPGRVSIPQESEILRKRTTPSETTPGNYKNLGGESKFLGVANN